MSFLVVSVSTYVVPNRFITQKKKLWRSCWKNVLKASSSSRCTPRKMSNGLPTVVWIGLKTKTRFLWDHGLTRLLKVVFKLFWFLHPMKGKYKVNFGQILWVFFRRCHCTSCYLQGNENLKTFHSVSEIFLNIGLIITRYSMNFSSY